MNRSKINLHRFCRGLALVLTLVSMPAGNLFAQNSTGTIRGTVSGEGGAPIGSAATVAWHQGQTVGLPTVASGT